MKYIENAVHELTQEQVAEIKKHVSRFFEGIEPAWEISFRENHWNIESNSSTICTFPMVPKKEELPRIVADGAALAPESLAPIWRAYLSFLVEKTIPNAFLEQGIRL
jgi:hypothetical protein